MDEMTVTAAAVLTSVRDDGRCHLVAVSGAQVTPLEVFDGHPFDRLVGWSPGWQVSAAGDGPDALALVLPAILPPSARLPASASRTAAAVTVASLRTDDTVAVDRGGAPLQPYGLSADLLRRCAGHDVALPGTMTDVLATWWLALIDAELDDPAGVGPYGWDEHAGLRPDLLLAFLADAATSVPADQPHAVPARNAYAATTAAPDRDGVRLLHNGSDDWLVTVHDAALAPCGRSRTRPPLDPTEAGWLGPGMLARLEFAPAGTSRWRVDLDRLSRERAVPQPMLAGLVEHARSQP